MTSRLRLVWSRLQSLLMKDRLEREFDEELTTQFGYLARQRVPIRCCVSFR